MIKKLAVLMLTLFMVSSGALAQNELLGQYAGDAIDSGTGNTLLGDYAGQAVTTGTGNTALGMYAGNAITTGHGNTYLGAYAGRNMTTGSGNIIIGYISGDTMTATDSHKLLITTQYYPSYGIFGIISSGYFGINNISPTVALDITGAMAVSGTFTPAGSVVMTGDTLVISQETVVSNATEGADSSAIVLRFATEGGAGDPVIAFADSIGGTGTITYTGDTFTIADGAITTNSDLSFTSDAEILTDVIISGDTLVVSQEAVRANATEAADSSAIMLHFASEGGAGDPLISFADSTGGTGQITFANDGFVFGGASEDYSFSGGDIIAAGDTIVISQETTITDATEAADSSAIMLHFATEGGSGDPRISFADSVGGTGEYTYSLDEHRISGGGVVALADTFVITGEALVQWPAEADTSTIRIVNNEIFPFDGNGLENVLVQGNLHTGESPHATVTVNNTVKTLNFSSHGDDVANQYMAFIDRASDTRPPIWAIARAKGTTGAETIVADNNVLGRIFFLGYDGEDYAIGAAIRAVVDGTPGVGDMPTALTFGTTADGDSTTTDRVIISPTGTMTTYGNFIAMGDTNVFSAEAIIENPTEADTATVKLYYRSGNTGDPFVAFYDSIGGTAYINFTGDAFNFSGASGLYIFDDELRADKFTDRDNTSYFIDPAETDASGLLAGMLSDYKTINTVTTDSTMTTANFPSGTITTNSGAGATVEITLPAAAAGLHYSFVTVDTDSLIVIASSGDNIDDSSTADMGDYCAVGQLGETLNIVALDGTSWQVMNTTGTWAEATP